MVSRTLHILRANNPEKYRLVRDGILNCLALVATSLTGFVLVPILLKYLPADLYGVWIAATTLAYSTTFLNAGIGRSVAHEVARSSAAAPNAIISDFLSTAASAYGLFGVAGGVFVFAAGWAICSKFNLSPENRVAAHFVFCLVAISFFGDQLLSFAIEVLTGLRRFGLLNLFSASAVLLRSAVIVIVLRLGRSLIDMSFCVALLSLVSGIAALAIVCSLQPACVPRLVNVQWGRFRSQIGFSVRSQLACALSALLWRSPTVMIGLFQGAASIIPYEIGQKFPNAVYTAAWQSAEVVYPAASEESDRGDILRMSELLLIATRSLVSVCFPIIVVLWVVAPQLLTVWVGTTNTDAVWVLRLVSLAVLADIAAAGSIQLLWGKGMVGCIVKIASVTAVANILLMAAGIGRLGILAPALALCLTVCAASVTYMVTASRTCAVPVFRFVSQVTNGVLLPGLACAIALLALQRWITIHTVGALAALGFTGLLVYGGMFRFAALIKKRLFNKNFATVGQDLCTRHI